VLTVVYGAIGSPLARRCWCTDRGDTLVASISRQVNTNVPSASAARPGILRTKPGSRRRRLPHRLPARPIRRRGTCELGSRMTKPRPLMTVADRARCNCGLSLIAGCSSVDLELSLESRQQGSDELGRWFLTYRRPRLYHSARRQRSFPVALFAATAVAFVGSHSRTTCSPQPWTAGQAKCRRPQTPGSRLRWAHTSRPTPTPHNESAIRAPHNLRIINKRPIRHVATNIHRASSDRELAEILAITIGGRN